MEANTQMYIDARAERLAAMWRRFCRLMIDQGLGSEERLNCVCEHKHRALMIRCLHKGLPTGWTFESCLEAFDLGFVDGFDPPPALSRTDAAPGTRAKLETLARRATTGFDLWHPADAAEHHA